MSLLTFPSWMQMTTKDPALSLFSRKKEGRQRQPCLCLYQESKGLPTNHLVYFCFYLIYNGPEAIPYYKSPRIQVFSKFSFVKERRELGMAVGLSDWKPTIFSKSYSTFGILLESSRPHIFPVSRGTCHSVAYVGVKIASYIDN